jgi:hypothetical protein
VAYFVLKLKTMYAIKNTDLGCLRVLKNIFRSRRGGGGWDSRLEQNCIMGSFTTQRVY